MGRKSHQVSPPKPPTRARATRASPRKNVTADAGQCEQIKELLSGYLDNELTQQQSQRVALHVEQCESCRATLNQLEQLRAAIKGSDMPELEQDKIEALLNEPTSKMFENLGWAALIVGVTVSLMFAVFAFFGSDSISLGQKLLSSLIWGGLAGVFFAVVRQQLIARKTDKYKGVKL